MGRSQVHGGYGFSFWGMRENRLLHTNVNADTYIKFPEFRCRSQVKTACFMDEKGNIEEIKKRCTLKIF